VVDVSHPQADEQIDAVNVVLNEIGAAEKPTIMVFNKIDLLNGGNAWVRFQERFPHAVAVSATSGEGVAALLAEIGSQLRPEREVVTLRVPHEKSAVIARLHAVGQVMESSYRGSKARFKARIPPHFHAEFAPYVVD
jgi:GTP-binding protein HflX